MIAHPYEYTYAHPTPINISERLNQLDLDGMSPPTKRIINRKYNTHVKSKV
jgi:hypothetical protein